MVNKSLYHIESAVEILARIGYLRDSNRSEGIYEDDERDLEISDSLQGLLEDGVEILKQIVEDETSELVAVNKTASISKGAYMNELLKAARKTLFEHFTKAAAHHKAMNEEHDQLAAEHKALSETYKAMMADDECKPMHDHAKAMSAHSGAMSAHHTKMAKAHKGQMVHCEGMAASHSEDTTKALEAAEVAKAAAAKTVPVTKAAPAVADHKDPAADPAAAGTKDDPNNLTATIDGMVSKALTEAVGRVQNSPEVQKSIDEAVSAALMARLGGQMVPTAVKTAGITLVPRGQAGGVAKAADSDGIDMTGVPLDLADLVETEF